MESEGKHPTFAVCGTADHLEFYVLVVWPNGDETRLSHFATRHDAEGWIAREFAYWLRFRAETRLCPPLVEGGDLSIPDAACAQILQAA